MKKIVFLVIVAAALGGAYLVSSRLEKSVTEELVVDSNGTLNPQQLEEFRSKAREAGYSEEAIQAFISQKLEERQDNFELSPAPQPSQRSLKVASFAMVRMNDTQKKEIKQKYGDESISDTEATRLWAVQMDSDEALLSLNEAYMQQTVAREGQPVYYDESESIGDTNETLCQKATAKYQACMNEYTEKLGDYAECIENKTNYGYSSFCSSPMNFCIKPMCVN